MNTKILVPKFLGTKNGHKVFWRVTEQLGQRMHQDINLSQICAGLFPFFKPFDLLSIMAWYFPAELTSRKKVFRQNLTLSAGDKEFISRLYPYARTS
jgi:hypothetical protein